MKTKDKAMQWNNDEANQLFAIITKVCDLEKAYGQPGKDAKAICKVLEGWLHEDFTAAQVVYAVGELVKQSVKVPMPDEIRAFLNPQDRKITVGEYIQASKDYEHYGRQSGCQHLETILRFKEQNAEERKGIERRKERAASLGYDGHKIALADESVEFYLPKKFNQPAMRKIGDLS
jgi:hypothetical protein